MIDTDDCRHRMLTLLARWQAFSELQQRAFAFLASEALASGQEFENSTDGAAAILMKLASGQYGEDAAAIQAETWAVVHRLQAADRSRQGLEQVASVLTTLKRQHAELVAVTASEVKRPDIETLIDDWTSDLAANVTLADWRRRLESALHGREHEMAPATADEDEDVFF